MGDKQRPFSTADKCEKWGLLLAKLLKAHAVCFDAEGPGDECAQQGGSNEREQQRLGADVLEQEGEEKGGQDGSQFGKGGGESGTDAL